jgi:hypothetical protein
LIALDLGLLPLLLSGPGWALLVPLGVGTPFRPDQKVNLDKTEATTGGHFLRHGFLGSDVVTAIFKQRKLEWATSPIK